jgi:hypothetical protein
MMGNQFDEELGIFRIVFSPRRREGLAVFGESRGVDGIEDKKVVLEQGEDQRSACLLKSDSDELAGKTSTELEEELIESFRFVSDSVKLFTVCRAINEAKIVFVISPIDSDESSKVVPSQTSLREMR